ncbi:hypothetical protein DPMN_117234, partial [Dreissena polymorpha]
DDVWSRGFGSADISAGIPVNNSTLFAIGSVTKSFTMVLLSILLTEKKLDWTAKVMDILGPEYGFVDDYRTRESTLKDLLSHRTGLDGLEIGVISGYPKSVTREELCKKISFLPAQRAFRDGTTYNNYMYMLLGQVAEKLGGDTWENLMTSRVFRPIGMTSSRILQEPFELFKGDVARPYMMINGQFVLGTQEIYKISPLEASGAILSNGVDMAKYIRFNLNMGKTDNGTQLLDPKLLMESYTDISEYTGQQYRAITRPTFPVSDIHLGYGQGWIVGNYNGYKKVWHSGTVISYKTLAWMFPELRIGILGTSNGPAIDVQQADALTTILYHIIDRLLGFTPWINVTNVCTFPKPWQEEISMGYGPGETERVLQNAQEYTGYYDNNMLTGIKLEKDNESNTRLKFTMGHLKGNLYSTPHQDRFLMEFLSPAELYRPYMDQNNVTMKFNVSFERKNNEVATMQMYFNKVPLNFIKRGHLQPKIDTLSSGKKRLFDVLQWLKYIVLLTLTTDLL